MKKWENVFDRRDFIKLTALSGTTLLMSGCGVLPTKQKTQSPSVSSFLGHHGPIDRTLGDKAPKKFFGDENKRSHRALWEGSSYWEGRNIKNIEECPLVVVGGGVSGLFSAYSFRNHKPIILEQASRLGGNAKGQSWRGMDYSIGAAYIDHPAPGSAMEQLYKELNLEELLTIRHGDDAVEYNGQLYTHFWQGQADPIYKQQYAKLATFFNDLYNERTRPFPFIPSMNNRHLESVKYFDQYNLNEYLEKIVGGPLSPILKTAIEHFCWSTYCSSSKELSAAAGLNFLAQESGPIGVASGGNAKIAQRVIERILREVPDENLRTNSLVLSIEVKQNKCHVLYEDGNGQLNKLIAKTVIMSCPKFVANKIIKGLEQNRQKAISKLTYRSYMTANLLVDKKMKRGLYDVFLTKNGNVDLNKIEESQRDMNATDFIMGNFAHPEADHNILTFYRAFPFDGARAELYQKNAYSIYYEKFERQIEQDIFPLLGLKTSDIIDLRLALWGHALPLAKQGIYSENVVDHLRVPFKDRVFFIEQDNWAYPSLQTGATEVFLQHEKISKSLS